jgi:hypothetical protein
MMFLRNMQRKNRVAPKGGSRARRTELLDRDRSPCGKLRQTVVQRLRGNRDDFLHSKKPATFAHRILVYIERKKCPLISTGKSVRTPACHESRRYRRYGPPDVVQVDDIQKPSPNDSEVLIKMCAASVNPLDAGLMKASHSFRVRSGCANQG